MIFRGNSKPAKQVATGIKEAAAVWLKSSAEKVYHKYDLAPISLEATATQKLLQYDDLRSLPPALNELNLVNQNDLWRVRERDNYPANFSQIG